MNQIWLRPKGIPVIEPTDETAERMLPESLIDDLVISGNAAHIQQSLAGILSQGIDELLVTVLPDPEQELQEHGLLAALDVL